MAAMHDQRSGKSNRNLEPNLFFRTRVHRWLISSVACGSARHLTGKRVNKNRRAFERNLRELRGTKGNQREPRSNSEEISPAGPRRPKNRVYNFLMNAQALNNQKLVNKKMKSRFTTLEYTLTDRRYTLSGISFWPAPPFQKPGV